MVFWAAGLAAASAAAGWPNCRGGDTGAMSPITRAPVCAACAIGFTWTAWATGALPWGFGGTGLGTGRFMGGLLATAALGLGATGRAALTWPWPGCSLRGTALVGDGEGRACFLASAFFAALLLVVAFRTMSLAHSDLEFSRVLYSASRLFEP